MTTSMGESVSSSSLPTELFERLQEILPPQRLEAFFTSANSPRHVSIRVNTLEADSTGVQRRLEEAGTELRTVEWCTDAFLTDTTARALQDTADWQRGGFHVQSLSSIATALVLDPQPGERVLDMCAAPGSKTSHLAALMRNDGELVANDLSRARVHKLRAVLEHLGAHARIRQGPGEKIGRREPAAYDRVLVDAPCSGEGRIRHDEPASWESWRRSIPRRLSSRQKSLLHSAIEAVRPGGVIVYSTCTFAPEENELVLQRALERYSDRIELDPLPLQIPGALAPVSTWNGKPLPDMALARRLAPPQMDGFFIARLRRIA